MLSLISTGAADEAQEGVNTERSQTGAGTSSRGGGASEGGAMHQQPPRGPGQSEQRGAASGRGGAEGASQQPGGRSAWDRRAGSSSNQGASQGEVQVRAHSKAMTYKQFRRGIADPPMCITDAHSGMGSTSAAQLHTQSHRHTLACTAGVARQLHPPHLRPRQRAKSRQDAARSTGSSIPRHSY